MIPLTIEGIKENLYLVSENGQIYSKSKKDYLIPRKDKDGYLSVFLQKTKGGRNNKIYKRLASLILYSFQGPPPSYIKDPTVNHIDGNIENNHISNLEWMERSLNSSIRKNKGQGSKNSQSKLNEQKVFEILKLLSENKYTYEEIGNMYNVSKSTINNINRGENWKEVISKYKLEVQNGEKA